MRYSIKKLLGTAMMALSSVMSGANAQVASSPNNWRVYVTERDGAPVSVVYNADVGALLDALPEGNLVLLRIKLQSPQPNGLSSDEETDALAAFDDQIDRVMAMDGSFYLGRVTTLGERRTYLVAEGSAEKLGTALVIAAAKVGYAASFSLADDSAKEVYRTILMPSADEDRVAKDESVLIQLLKNNDDPTIVRPVDHWAYFKTLEAASAFADWAKKHEFSGVSISQDGDLATPYLVRSCHEGTMLLEDILSRTRQQDEKARELGGSYDGWETQVMRKSE